LLQPTANAKSNDEFYKNGYRADVEMMQGRIRTDRTPVTPAFAPEPTRRSDNP
jgi:hypothetical protein